MVKLLLQLVSINFLPTKSLKPLIVALIYSIYVDAINLCNRAISNYPTASGFTWMTNFHKIHYEWSYECFSEVPVLPELPLDLRKIWVIDDMPHFRCKSMREGFVINGEKPIPDYCVNWWVFLINCANNWKPLYWKLVIFTLFLHSNTIIYFPLFILFLKSIYVRNLLKKIQKSLKVTDV